MSRNDRELVSASELAQLGYCERVAHFDWRDGARRTSEQVKAQDRGNAAHDQFYRDSVTIARASEKKGRCFVATLALGECRDTSTASLPGSVHEENRSGAVADQNLLPAGTWPL
jgi:hypothetical protein